MGDSEDPRDPAWGEDGPGRPISLHAETAEGRALAPALLDRLSQAMDDLGLAPETAMALVLSDDAELQRLNRAYRDLDRPTDVLSFAVDAGDLPPEEAPYLGDVLISLPYAARNAEVAGHGLPEELALLAVHGLLHLLGYDDEEDAAAEEMRALEISLGLRPADDPDCGPGGS
jgi:probable rRNA maturation factor